MLIYVVFQIMKGLLEDLKKKVLALRDKYGDIVVEHVKPVHECKNEALFQSMQRWHQQTHMESMNWIALFEKVNITSTVNTMHDNVAEVSVHSEVEDVTTTVCDDLVSRSNISMVCEAEVLPTKMVKNVVAPIDSQVDGTRTGIAPTLMPIYAQGQTMPNDAARYMSSNGYPLPRLTLM